MYCHFTFAYLIGCKPSFDFKLNLKLQFKRKIVTRYHTIVDACRWLLITVLCCVIVALESWLKIINPDYLRSLLID